MATRRARAAPPASSPPIGSRSLARTAPGTLGRRPRRGVWGYLGGERAGNKGFHQLPDRVDCLDGSGILRAVRDSPQPSDQASDSAIWADCRALVNDAAGQISWFGVLDLLPSDPVVFERLLRRRTGM